MIRDVHPGSGAPFLDLDFLTIPDPGSEVLDVFFLGIKASQFSCSLHALRGVLEKIIFKFFYIKNIFFSCKILHLFCHQRPGSGSRTALT
jgi:hypothetical protein